jgi:hypothetical protein
MANSKDLIQKVASGIVASSTHSPTAAGRPKATPANPQLIDAINQVFALFQVNYHNQYYSAFGNSTKSENLAKKLWLSKLENFSAETICGAAEKIIAESDYLPTLHKMLNACSDVGMPEGLPSPYNAYQEACNKPSPKAEQQWSHPAVYVAGRECGWYFLANTAESKAFSLFADVYKQLCEQVLAGETFTVEKPEVLAETSVKPATKKQARAQLDNLKGLFN